jgi:CheY-like chemotaxis protein
MRVLLVEDNPGDADLTKETLEDGSGTEVTVVDDGAKALDYLRRRPPYESSPRPNLVLLDLNLPKLDGRQVLGNMRDDPALKGVPVVVLTSSDAIDDITNSYALGANCYVTKPVGIHSFQTSVRAIARFWSDVVKLP